MTRVYVDISIFTPSNSVGVISGYLNIDIVPAKGESLSFENPITPNIQLSTSNFNKSIEVKYVSPPVAGTKELLISLADITVPTRVEAMKVANYLQQGFGLYFDEN